MPEILEKTFTNETEQEKEKISDIAKYWRRFGFPGKPPQEGTPAEERLIKISQEYFDTALMCERMGNPKGSDAKRRELHNQLGLMIFGKQRTDMSESVAEAIADFASYVTTGTNLRSAIAEIIAFDKENGKGVLKTYD
ncbi:MAG: hypothetical protein PHO56_02980 [Patescibacteria group bacterium]|nr:hypothetical protein [Patescibacteria group bacterium]